MDEIPYAFALPNSRWLGNFLDRGAGISYYCATTSEYGSYPECLRDGPVDDTATHRSRSDAILKRVLIPTRLFR